MSLLLIKPEHDVWSPGKHTGTFRGNNLAFVCATKSLDFWKDDNLSMDVVKKEQLLYENLQEIISKYQKLNINIRGRGLIYGLDFSNPIIAIKVREEAFKKGLIIETAGHDDSIIKLLPALNISHETLKLGLCILKQSIIKILEKEGTYLEYCI